MFASGSIQWVWGLDSTGALGPRVDARVQQMVVNLLNNMGAVPSSPDPALVIP